MTTRWAGLAVNTRSRRKRARTSSTAVLLRPARRQEVEPDDEPDTFLSIEVRKVCWDCRRPSADCIALYFACMSDWIRLSRVVQLSICLLRVVERCPNSASDCVIDPPDADVALPALVARRLASESAIAS